MAQFLAEKAKHPDALLFFRMGDFYELFFEDAQAAARALDIALTKRGQHQGQDIPMCGVPAHAADSYLSKLIRAGFKVAVCEQMEDPALAKKRGAKSIVHRSVIRVVTPGTITEDVLLEARAANRLAGVAPGRTGEDWAIAWADISTGEFAVHSCPAACVAEELAALAPRELIAGEKDCVKDELRESGAALGLLPTPVHRAKLDAKSSEARLRELFDIASTQAFGDFSAVELGALALVAGYVSFCQAGGPPRLQPPRRASASGWLAIDPATRASLEIDRTLKGARAGALLHCVDRTISAAGARLLADRLARPLADTAAINKRLDAVAYFVDGRAQREAVRGHLQGAADLTRAVTRLALRRGGPRDLSAVAGALQAAAQAAAALKSENGLPEELADANEALNSANRPELAALCVDLTRALGAALPVHARDGGFIIPGFDPSLDETRALRDDARKVVAALQARYAEETQLPFKVKHNNVLGYHLELPIKHLDAMLRPPLSEKFIHRQTLPGAARFSTPELADLDRRIAHAGDEALAREMALFEGFVGRILGLESELRAAAAALAALDVHAALAEWAVEQNACRPQIDDSLIFEAKGARHPVVEQAVNAQSERFSPNDCLLDAAGAEGKRLLFITGPNMAGKSTFLRQNALLIVLAQAGAFVPAQSFRAGFADRLFSRVGAADELARGRSTFMAEMVETAAILRQSGQRAFVILDEIGRGTATFDGLAIAWSAAEHLHDNNKCRALFATHYHELTRLDGSLPKAGNLSFRAKEWRGNLVFLHEAAAGPADRSYGIEVARRAGLPQSAVTRARQILAMLEAHGTGGGPASIDSLPLFAAAPIAPALTGFEESQPDPGLAEVAEMLEAANPDALSPRDALDLVYRLRDALKAR
ncbi:MAG: DNA mismatch repair protein MutS [Caulobacterales bacterium]